MRPVPGRSGHPSRSAGVTPKAAALRLAFYYATLFATVGIHLPFWPVWLADRGLSASEIGLVAAFTYLSRMFVNPVVGAIVDRRGDRRRPMVLLAAAAALVWVLFAVIHGLVPILAVTLLGVGLWAGIMPVGDSLSMMAASHWQLDYGRVRLWGSAAFIIAATLGGRLLLTVPPAILVWLVAGGLAATAGACALLPDLRGPVTGGRPPPLAPLLTSRPFLLFLAATSLNQGAHTVYYAFATLHWRAAGIADDTIGLLWSEGVVAEIALFALSAPLIRRLGPAGLLLVAMTAGILRWLVLGATTQIPILAAVQVLHAATFGCAHLGAMHFLQRAVPPGLNVRAQGLYAATAMGIVPGLMSPVTGWLYQHGHGQAFSVMAGLSAAAALAAWGLSRTWHGGKVVE